MPGNRRSSSICAARCDPKAFMTTWSHVPVAASIDWSDVLTRHRLMMTGLCAYCGSVLATLTSDQPSPQRARRRPRDASDCQLSDASSVDICRTCGWWHTPLATWVYPGACSLDVGNVGVLKNLDLTDVRIPLSEIRTYLLARFERRGELAPRLLEETVGAVMADLGFSVEVTGRTGDGGIDVILQDPGGRQTIGVQVKRHKASIKVEQIRSLMGALMLRGLTRGVFVTTSSFQPGAVDAAERSAALGIPIELVDATRFFSALQITARSPYKTFAEWKAEVGEFHDIPCGWNDY